MKYPFKNYKNPERFLEEIEANAGGHYPFGISSFWHSGIHIYSSSQKEFSPIINGSVICYRISESYKQVQLPQILSKDDLNNAWSEYIDLYEKGNKCKLKSENNNKTYPISDCFILLQHEVTIDKKKFIFYTLYANLAPKCDYSEYNENLIIDGKIHGSAINTNDKEFFVDIIGKPAKNKKEIYFDYILLSKESLNKFSSKNGIKDFWNIDKNTKFYTRTKSSTEAPDKNYIPKWTEINSEEYIDGDEKVYKNTIKYVQVYLNSSQVKNNILKDISSLTFSRGSASENILEPTDNQKYIFDLIKNEVTLLKDKEVDYYPRSTFQYIKVSPKQPIIFWTKKKITTIELQGEAPLYVDKYDSNPLQYKYQLQNNVPDEIKNKVQNVSNIKLQGSDNQTYYQLMFSDIIDEEYYINETEKNRCFKPLLDFDNWFYFSKESDSIICDKTDLIKNVINTHDNLVKTALLLSPIIGIWWTGAIITWDFLKYIFGINSKTKESLGGDLTKKELRKVICRHPIEFNKDQFKDISKNSQISKDAEANLVNESTAIDLWNGGLNKIFNGNPYYANPIYLINHFEKANLFEFNPYKDKDVSIRHPLSKNDKNKVVDKKHLEEKTTKVTFNPGFAPAVPTETNSSKDNKFLSNCSYRNMDFAAINFCYHCSAYKDVMNFKHTGVDFPGSDDGNNKNAPIVALISGRIWACTSAVGTIKNGDTAGSYGRCMIIKGNNEYLYLLGHLNDFANHKAGDFFNPGDTIAHAGNTGNSGGTHLHLEVIKCPTGMDLLNDRARVLDMEYNQLHETDGGEKGSKKAVLRFAIGENTIWKATSNEEWKNHRINPLTGE